MLPSNITQILAESKTFSEVLRKLGRADTGGMRRHRGTAAAIQGDHAGLVDFGACGNRGWWGGIWGGGARVAA